MWFRDSPQTRSESKERILSITDELSGTIVSEFELSEICYHSLVASVPASQIRRLVLQEEFRLLGDSAIMYFRPSGQAIIPRIEGSNLQTPTGTVSAELPQGDPVVALLDAIPLENHVLLAGRLQVDDPDGYGNLHISAERDHGTTMASNIIYGDLSSRGNPISKPLYVRPILRPDPQPWDSARVERIPFGVNPLDLTYRAVRRLFEADGDLPAVSPSIKIISFSIGDPQQPFNSVVSSWGRLLDWLAVNYNILFCVSAGNYIDDIELDIPRANLSTLNARQLENEVIKALKRDLRLRRILCPSDSINALTIGAWHFDSSGQTSFPNRINPYHSEPMPSPLNGLGCGFRNSSKPDVFFPGGRQLYSEKLGNLHSNATLLVNPSMAAPGILSASPSNLAGQLDREKYTCGTSNATAFASRSATFLYEQVTQLRTEAGGERLNDEFAPVLLKAMLVHRATWGAAYSHIRRALKPETMREDKFKRIASRFLGFGFTHPIESIMSSDNKATMIGCGELNDGQGHEYQVPLPQSLSGVRGLRRIAVSLAWLSPVHPRHRNYRRASMWFEIQNEKLKANRLYTDWKIARNGTIQHEVFEGNLAAVFADSETMLVKVNCRADAGSLNEIVRYGLLITIEVAEELNIPVYNEIVNRIRPSVEVRASTP